MLRRLSATWKRPPASIQCRTAWPAHQLSLTAAVLFAAGRSHEGVRAVAQADALLVALLKWRPALPVWEAMLRDWSRLDAMAVRWLTQQSGEGSAERALLRAEAAKGRIQAWLENAAHLADGGAAAFDSARLQAGLGRVQAWVTLAIGGADAVVGGGAGRDALMGALRHPDGPLLLSTHARFEPTNPFTSYLVAADGHLALHQFLRVGDGGMAPAVILGACEAGKSRRSLSDEPFGFPMMLLQLGCREVAAPCWKVDDFASFVLLTECCARLANGVTLPEATMSKALSVKDMTPAAALERLEAALALATEPGRAEWAERSGLLHQAAGLRRWLNKLEPVDRPFESPLDWAAFQVSVSALR
jgi:CHAT domain